MSAATPSPGRTAAESRETTIRAGDHVLHRPSGETWLVAWADPATNDIAWCGWPDGMARLSDCTLVKAASDAEHVKLLRELKRSGGSRGARAIRIYGDPDAAADNRDGRQDQVRDWVVRCWGENAVGVRERVERFFEEAVELMQAEGVHGSRLLNIIGYVYNKEPGDPAQEVGGIGTTLLAYCASKGLSADNCERAELTRILGKPVEHFRQRHAAKVESGLATAITPAGARP